MKEKHTYKFRLSLAAGIIAAIAAVFTFSFISPHNEVYAEELNTTTVSVPSSLYYNNERIYPTMINDAALYISSNGTLYAVIVPYTETEALARTGDSLKVVIPSSVKKIAADAFGYSSDSYDGCTSTLRSLTIPSGVTVESGAFYGVTLGNVAYFPSVVPSDCFMYSTINSINFGSTVKTINTSAVYGCELNSLIVGTGVTSISDYAFNCSAKNVTIGAGISTLTYKKIGGIYNIESFKTTGTAIKKLAQGCFNYDLCNTLKTVTLGNSVTAIDKYVFSNYSALTTVTAEGVTSAGAYAFSYCPSLTTVKMNKITAIPEYLFKGSGLTSYTIPSSVKSIGDYAFANTKLKKLTIGGNIASIGSSILCETPIEELSIGAHVSTLEYTSFYNMPELKKLYIWGSYINTIGFGCFDNCTKLTSVSIGSCVKTIESCAFEDTALTTVTIPSSVTSIGSSVFNKCTNLKTIVLAKLNDTFVSNSVWMGTNNATIVCSTCDTDMFYPFKICGAKVSSSTAIGLNFTNLTMLKGDKMQLKLNNTGKYKGTFSSANTSIATVDANGYVTAKATGTTTITVKFNGVSYNCKITVIARTVQNRCKQLDWNYGLSYMSDYHIVKACYIWMAVNCCYDYTYTRYYEDGILLDYTGVCNSYMCATRVLMNYFGIDNVQCTSWEMNHTWNIIKIGKNYFHLDATWGDFLSTDTQIQSSGHYAYSPEGKCKFTYIDKNYYTKIRKLHTPVVTVANTDNTIKVSWNQVKNAAGYIIYKKTGSGNFVKYYTVTSGSKLYIVDSNVKSGTTYQYYVVAYNGSVKSANSATKTIVRLTTPKTTLTNSTVSVKVSWTKTTGATGYYVYRKEGSGSWVKIATTTSAAAAYWDKTAVKGKTYTYTVKAYKGTSVSNGNTVQITH